MKMVCKSTKFMIFADSKERKSGGSSSRAANVDPGDAENPATGNPQPGFSRESRKRSTATSSSGGGGNNLPEEKILVESET